MKKSMVLGLVMAIVFLLSWGTASQACDCGVKVVEKTTVYRVYKTRTFRAAKCGCGCDVCDCPSCDCGAKSTPVQTPVPTPATIEPVPAVQAAKVDPCCGPTYQLCVKDARKISCGSEKQTVQVYDKRKCCCVAVDICVPPCATKDLECYSRHVGNTTTYRFPGHNVQIRFRGDTVEVDYDT